MSYISNPSSGGGGGGSGTVTAISAGTGITLTPNPITTVGVVALTVPVTVPLGGTGLTTATTAYAPIISGTTATGAFQVASVGLSTAGFVLTSNGNSAVPSFQAAPSSPITLTADTGGPLSSSSFTLAGGLNMATSGSGTTITFAAAQAQYLTSYRVANATPFVVNATDFYITVDTSTTAITIQLPDAPTIYRRFIIKDSSGNASVKNVTVTTVSGVKFLDAATTFVMNTNYQAAEFVYDNFGYQIF